jgi:BirA family transcriptional regulator, biotin operon repressor / biotin---[acetyl-CoA-carboxylase] ligase
MLSGAKLGGILLERSGDRVVAGFGVNLAAAPAIEGRATADLGGTIAPQAFAPLLAASFDRLLAAWRSSEPAALAMAWEQRAHPRGTRVTVHASAEQKMEGRFDGIDPDGALRLEVGGDIHVIRAGDVSLANGGSEG